MTQLEKSTGKDIQSILDEHFAEFGSQRKVAEALGISQGTLSVWLLKLGLTQRTILVKREKAS